MFKKKKMPNVLCLLILDSVVDTQNAFSTIAKRIRVKLSFGEDVWAMQITSIPNKIACQHATNKFSL